MALAAYNMAMSKKSPIIVDDRAFLGEWNEKSRKIG
jgi:hypothetical protein